MSIIQENPYALKLAEAHRRDSEEDIEKYQGLWKAFNEELIDEINIKKEVLEVKLTEVKKVRGIRLQYEEMCRLYSDVASFLLEVRRAKENVRIIRYKKRYLNSEENENGEIKRTEVGKENLQEVMDEVKNSKDLRRFVEVFKDK